MFTYSFENIGKESLYIHLYNCIKEDIVKNNLTNGAKLPSKRAAAKNLGVSIITVENAYAQLQSEGYIFSLPKKGYYVSDISAIYTPKIYAEKNEHFDFSYETTPEYKYDFLSNKTNSENFPFASWAKLMREKISENREELMTASPCGGVKELREAISAHLKQFRNMNTEPEQIIIGAGAEYLYSLIIQLLGHNKIYALENPGYKKVASIYKSNHAQCKFINCDKNGMKISELMEKNADVVHVSPSHHYPTGTVMPIGRRYELLRWASLSAERYIIEDDYDSEFRLSGRPLPTLQSTDDSDKVIYINTFTKSLAPTIRISYMVLPKKLLENFFERFSFYSCTVSTFEQYTLASFIKNGYFEKHINRMRNYYRKIRDCLLLEIKKSPLNEICTVSEEEAGLHFLLKVKTDLKDKQITKNALKHSLRISFLSNYYLEESENAEKNVLIMNYSGLKEENIHGAVKALCQSILE